MQKEHEKKKMGTATALAIAILSFGAFTGMASIVVKNQSLITPVTLAEDNEDGGDSEESQKSEDKDKKENKVKEKESTKKQYEKDREENKKKFEKDREENKQADEIQGKDEDGNEQEMDADGDFDGDESSEFDTDGDFEDNNGMYKDSNKTLSKLQENIAEAEKHILEKQAEGEDVTKALSELNLAKAKLAEVGTAFTANDFEMAKQLSKEIKKEALFSEKDLEFAKDATEAVREVTKKVAKVDSKIATLESLGGDASLFKTQVASLKTDISTLQSSGTITREAFKAIEKKAERLKNVIEQSIFALGGNEENDDLYADHEKDAHDLEDDLNDVADIEEGDDNGVAKKVRTIAEEHRSSTAVIAQSLGDIKNQSGFAKTVFGPDFNALESLNAQTTAMTVRADALVAISTQVTDPDVKQILIDRAGALRSEASKLSAYISAENNQFSILGKFLSLFR